MSEKKDIPTMQELERAAILRALAFTDTKREAAEELGMSRSTFFRRLKEHGLSDQPAGLSGFGLGTPGATEGLLSDVLGEDSEDEG